MKKGRLKARWGPSAPAPCFAALRYKALQESPLVTPAPAVEAVSYCVSWCLSAFRSLPCDFPNLSSLPPWKCLREGEGSSLCWQAYKRSACLPACLPTDFSQ